MHNTDKMNKKMLVCFMGLLITTSCLAQSGNKAADRLKHVSLTQVAWLQGNWRGIYNNAPFYEAWRRATDSVLVNFLIEINGSDTVVKENGAIRLFKNREGYISKNASWQLDSLSDNIIVLKNDTLSFANRIIWSHTDRDHWLTEIHNPKGIIHYDLERVPWLDEIVDRFIRNAARR